MNFIYFISAFTGAVSVNLLNKKINNFVRTSSVVTILFYILIQLFGLDEHKELLIISSFYGGSFIGMSSHEEVSSILFLLSSLFFTFLFILLIPYLGGLGGALGICAFLSVFFISAFKKVIFMKR